MNPMDIVKIQIAIQQGWVGPFSVALSSHTMQKPPSLGPSFVEQECSLAVNLMAIKTGSSKVSKIKGLQNKHLSKM